MISDRRSFLLLIGLGLVIRIALTATSLGTNDVIFKVMWAQMIEEHGVLGAYARHEAFSQGALRVAIFPPLTLLTFEGMSWLSRLTGGEYTDVFRYVQTLADLVAVSALLLLARRQNLANPLEPALFYFLMPAAVFISAFHCNTDSTMVAFLVLAAALVSGKDPNAALGGLSLAAATGIKLLPLFALPFFLVSLGRRATGFAVAYLCGFAAIFLPAGVMGGTPVLNNIFLYSGYPGKWGIPGLLLEAERLFATPKETVLYNVAYLYAIHGKYVVLLALGALTCWFWWRERMLRQGTRDLVRILPIVYLVVLFTGPGFGVQYLLWPIPFLLFAFSTRFACWIGAVFSAYLFIAYTIWSEGFPWWYADSMAPVPLKSWVTYLGFPVWGLIGFAIALGLRRMQQQHREHARLDTVGEGP